MTNLLIFSPSPTQMLTNPWHFSTGVTGGENLLSQFSLQRDTQFAVQEGSKTWLGRR